MSKPHWSLAKHEFETNDTFFVWWRWFVIGGAKMEVILEDTKIPMPPSLNSVSLKEIDDGFLYDMSDFIIQNHTQGQIFFSENNKL